MKKIFLMLVTMLIFAASFSVINIQAAEKTMPGEKLFVKNCAVCHAGGGNIINPAKTLKQKDLNANNIKTPADIVRNMRNPGPGMTKFDATTIPDKEAREIAEYILKTFR